MVIRDFSLLGLSSYPLLYAIGGAGSIYAYMSLGRRKGLPVRALAVQVACVAILAYGGARLLHFLQQQQHSPASSGSASYGAFLAGIVGFELLRRWLRLDGKRAYDSAALAVMLMVIFGRLGCFFGGCCFGTPSSCALSVQYPAHGLHGLSPAYSSHHALGWVSTANDASLAVHPVQLYLAGWALLGLALLTWRHKWLQNGKGTSGKLMPLCLFWHCAGRFALECLRGDSLAVCGPLHKEHLYSLFGMLAVVAQQGWVGVASRSHLSRSHLA